MTQPQSTVLVTCGICRGRGHYEAVGGHMYCDACGRTGTFTVEGEDLAVLTALRRSVGRNGLATAALVGGSLGLNGRQMAARLRRPRLSAYVVYEQSGRDLYEPAGWGLTKRGMAVTGGY